MCRPIKTYLNRCHTNRPTWEGECFTRSMAWNISSDVCVFNSVGLFVCIDQIYLLHRPAPGPSPCPLHTQQNSGRNGKKPIPWPILRSRSSSTRLWWWESSVYFTLWVFIADAANPKCLSPLLWSVRWAESACTHWSAVWLWWRSLDPAVVISFVQRGGGEEAVCRPGREGEREGGDKGLNASSSAASS